MSEERERIEQLNAQVAALSYAVGIAVGVLEGIQHTSVTLSADDALKEIRELVSPLFYPRVYIPTEGKLAP